MKNAIWLLVCFAFAKAYTAQAQLHDWKNAPLNPMSEYARNHVSSNAGIKGQVATVSNKWYDDKGFEIKENVFEDVNDAAKYQGVYYVMDNGNIIRKQSYYRGKATIAFYTYDKNGRVLTSKENDRSSVVTYDAKGRVIKQVDTSPTFEYTTNYTYKNSGKDLIINEKMYNKDKVLVNEFTYTYRDGLLVKRQEGNIETKVYTYEYDKQGSWIKRLANGSVDTVRVIIYKDQIQNLSDATLVIKQGSYSPVVVAMLGNLEVPFLKGKLKQFTYFYNPIDKQYYMYETDKVQVTKEQIGKTMEYTKREKGNAFIRFTDGNAGVVNGKTI